MHMGETPVESSPSKMSKPPIRKQGTPTTGQVTGGQGYACPDPAKPSVTQARRQRRGG